MSVEYKNIKSIGATSQLWNQVGGYSIPTGRTALITSVNVCNTSTSEKTFGFYLRDTTGAYKQILASIAMDGETTLEMIDGQKIVMLAGEKIYHPNESNSIDIIVSLMEIY